MKKRIECEASGRVQNVLYRAHALKGANSLGICGYVKNLDNGKVKIVAEADTQKLHEYIELLKSGSLSSEVQDVVVRWSDSRDEFEDFQIIY